MKSKMNLQYWLDIYSSKIKRRGPNKITKLFPELFFLKSKFIQVIRVELLKKKIKIFLVDF